MNIQLITDTHFNHRKIIEYDGRPNNFEELILKNLLNISEDSILIHLGDVCIGKDISIHKKYIKPIKCRQKILIRGNHDEKSSSWYLDNGWDFVCDEMIIKYLKKRIKLTHRPSDFLNDCDINIHGHVHTHQYARKEKHIPISIEVEKYKPINLNSVIKKYDNNIKKS